MSETSFKQLNPFELKHSVTELLQKLNSVSDLQGCLTDFEMLDAQENKSQLERILFKELVNAQKEKIPIICFMLEHFVPKDRLVTKFWETLKNENLQTEVKITILNLLRDLDADWSYENCEQYLDDGGSLLDENTKKLLNSAIINPEVQIDFMDFMATIRVQDKIALINSLADDFGSDELANILIPVFVSNPESAEGKEALKLLAQTKSVLALHTLEEMKNFATGELLQEIKRSLSTIKIAGIREDNTKDFYKKVLSDSKPHKFYVTYPDGHGDVAMIFTRKTSSDKIRFVSIVINIENGIRDCFGFFEISQFECEKILERFLKDEKTVEINPETFKTILNNAEQTTIKRNQNKWKLPYEYVCWKNLLIDIDYDNETINEIIDNSILSSKVDADSINALSKMKISAHWFMDEKYSPEFEDLLKELNGCNDLQALTDKHFDKIFTAEEKKLWVDKLIFSAYIKYTKGKDAQAGMILGITKDETVLNELFTNILKRSIYEYLTLVKYDKNVDSYGLTHDEIEDKIKFIESKWVQNV